MKNTFKIFGIIALFAVIGFSMLACSSDDDSASGPKSFDGTWVMSGNTKLGYTYNGTSVTQFNDDLGLTWSGTFTYTNTTITMTFPEHVIMMYYTLTDTYLELKRINSTDTWWYGRFNKK